MNAHTTITVVGLECGLLPAVEFGTRFPNRL